MGDGLRALRASMLCPSRVARSRRSGREFRPLVEGIAGVSYTHPERGYGRLARQVRESLQRGRCVVVLMIDALALHLARRRSATSRIT